MITLTYITRIHYHNGNTILATQYTKETDFISQKLQQLITAMQTKKQPMPLDDRTGEGDDEE